MNEGKIRVLSHSDRLRQDRNGTGDTYTDFVVRPASYINKLQQSTSSSAKNNQLGWKDPDTVLPFKLIDDKEWNLISNVPKSETAIFENGHSALNIISVIGLQGSGKSSLMNNLANKDVFSTHTATKQIRNLTSSRHITKGVDILATYDRILLDCQPLLSASVLEDIIDSQTSTPMTKNYLTCDPITKGHIISLELATFLIAISDFVIIVNKWGVDVHLLKLISTAILMIGDDNVKAKFIIFSENVKSHDSDVKRIVDGFLGTNRVEKYLNSLEALRRHVATYSAEKCEMYKKDPFTFTGKNWLLSCQRVWEMSIKNSSMFTDYRQRLMAGQTN